MVWNTGETGAIYAFSGIVLLSQLFQVITRQDQKRILLVGKSWFKELLSVAFEWPTLFVLKQLLSSKVWG